jgi:hypothetical protein
MAGFKTFVDLDILTAAEVNDFLMTQAVMVFADAAARTTALPTPSEGMVTYLEDTDSLEVFTGASFVLVNDNTAAILKAIIDAKGDLIVGTAADTPARLPVGTDGQVLTADSNAASGVAWTTLSTPAVGVTIGLALALGGN